MIRSLALRLLVASLATLGVASLTQCVDARCTRNSECAAGQICVTATGVCRAPDCTSDGECGAGRICEQFACVSGCRGDAECPSDQRCFSNRCVPRDEACDCATAPRFCGVDLNPLSPTAGDTVCVPDAFSSGGVLFFGSVLCSHCQAILDALEVLQSEVAPAGDAPMVFVQEPTIEVGSSTVEGALAGATLAVVQDGPDLGVWPAYGADWYHVVLVDRNGCLAKHWGPLAPTDVSDSLHVEMRDAWLAAQDAVCTPAAPEADNAESTPEAVEPTPEVIEPAPEVTPGDAVGPGPEAQVEPVPDAVEVFVDAHDASPAEAEAVAEVEVIGSDVSDASDASDAWVEPFTLQDTCQAVVGSPAAIGGLVPHFLCKDVNTASAAFGGAFSDITLREQVWIAYFGTCT